MARSGLQDLGRLLHAFDEVLEKIPEAREKALEAAGERVKKELDRQIVARLPGQDRHGHVRSWQETTMGSKGGYLRIKPTNKETVKEPYNSRQVTGYLERGHKIAPSRRGRYRAVSRSEPAPKKGSHVVTNESNGDLVVKGFQFYSWTRSRAANEARKAAEIVLEELEDTLEDL